MWFWCCQEKDDKGDVVVHSCDYTSEVPVVETTPILVNRRPKDLILQPPQSWTVQLARAPDDNSLGLELEIDSQKRLSILKEPETGPALAWNHTHPTKRFLGGDIVEAVNGIIGDSQDLLKLIKESENVVLNMTRLVDFTVCVEKKNGLGLEVAECGGRVVVESVLDGGVLKKHNSKCLAGYRVTPGTWLVAVNDTGGKPQDLMQKLQALERGPTLLRFRRVPPS